MRKKRRSLQKIPDTSGLVTTAVWNTKFSEVANKNAKLQNLVTVTVLNTNIREFENKIPDILPFKRLIN